MFAFMTGGQMIKCRVKSFQHEVAYLARFYRQRLDVYVRNASGRNSKISSIFPSCPVFPAWPNGSSVERPLEPKGVNRSWRHWTWFCVARDFCRHTMFAFPVPAKRRLNPAPRASVVNHLPQFVPSLQLIVSPTAPPRPHKGATSARLSWWQCAAQNGNLRFRS